MPRGRTGTAIKFVLGFLLGVVLVYYALENFTEPGWRDSAKAGVEDCASQGLNTRVTVAEGVVKDLECVPPDETEASGSDST